MTTRASDTPPTSSAIHSGRSGAAAGAGADPSPADDPAAWDNYIRESIINPNAKVHSGYPAAMSSFAGVFTDEEIGWIIEYIKSLSDKAPAPAEGGTEGGAGEAEGGASGETPEH